MTGVQISGMIYFIAAMVFGFAGLGFAIYKSVTLTKDRRQTIDYKSYFKVIIPALAVFAILYPLALLSIYIGMPIVQLGKIIFKRSLEV